MGTEYEIEIWDNSVSEWKFYGSTSAADIGPNCACPHTLASTTYVVTGLKQDHQYLFRVYAKNSIGRSNPAETSTLAAPKKTRRLVSVFGFSSGFQFRFSASVF